jgi:excinuclease UvrABC ATPase subunit
MNITVSGARTHNLANIDVSIPKHQFTVVTGVSGSGKSSLVFDTIAAEAQRAASAGYPTFVRNRLPQHPPAEVDRIEGLTFTTVVDQRRFTGNSRSTVATATDVAGPVRILFSRFASPSAGFSPAYNPNDPSGMCRSCDGLGVQRTINENVLIDPDKSLREGPVRFPTFRPGSHHMKRFIDSGLADPEIPWAQLPETTRDPPAARRRPATEAAAVRISEARHLRRHRPTPPQALCCPHSVPPDQRGTCRT